MRLKFSKKELWDLLKAWLALSLAFTILLSRGGGLHPLYAGIISVLVVGTGFVFHEMGHKLVAQKYGCWAEFRSNDMMLLVAIGLSFLGFIFAAPGAVMIMGRVGVMRNGKISLAGPAMNFGLAFVFLGVYLLNISSFLSLIGLYGMMINSLLGTFNLIPFGNFDGRKILAWNKIVYGALVVIGVILVAASFMI